MSADALPAWWRTGSAAFSVPDLIAELEDSLPGSARHDLLIALQHARARAEQDPWGSPEHVRYAQAVLEIAVEWAMPAVERWAVAWLTAAGVGYLRLRWSSRSRDGRTRRDGLAPSPISAITAGSGRAIIGCEDGFLGQWTDEAGLSTLHEPPSPEPALSAVASRGELVFAVSARGHVRTSPGSWTVPAPRDSQELNAALNSAAITPGGDVACGDNRGRLLICPAGGTWLPPLQPPGGRRGATISALSFGPSSLWAVWDNGWVTEARPGAGGAWAWYQERQPQRRPVAAAAFDGACERAAIAYDDGTVSVLYLREMAPVPCWPEHAHRLAPTRSVAWSPDGLLAVSQALIGASRLLFGQPGQDPEQISSRGSAGRVAYIDDDHLVRIRDREIAGWAIHDAGSDVPDPLQHEITAVTVDPLDPGRTMVGTVHGGVLCYDERGLATPLVADYGPVGGRVHELARMGDEWLIAAQSGAYRLTRTGEVSRLPSSNGAASYVCKSVAATGQDSPSPDGAYACQDRVRTVSGGEAFTFASAIRDIRSGPGGVVAAIDDDGCIRARDRSGTPWSVPDARPSPGRLGRSGWRLLAVGADSVIVWNPAGQSRRHPHQQVQRFSRHGQATRLDPLPADAIAGLALGSGIVVACRDRGVALTGIGESPAGVSTPVTVIGGSGHRIVAAAGQRIAGYDVMPAAGGADGSIPITVTGEAGRFLVTLPGGERSELDAGLVQDFGLTSRPGGEGAAGGISDPVAKLVDTASQIGDQLWRCGLARALDLARGDDPDRPVRLIWHCDDQTDDLPWELVHPTLSPLGWFADPPITSVRTARRRGDPAGREPTAPAGAPLARYRMLVLRGTADELAPSAETYVYTSRRTRLRNVRMLNPEPVLIESQEDLDRELREPVDILQVWAHCNRDRAEFSDGFALGTGELARQLAPRVSRLAVIVGCESGALARTLVTEGVEAVVAMRTKVFSGTIQPLVAELIALVLGGLPIDLAFGRALHSYVLTGQPGAAAVPMLYLADGSTGELFH